MAQHLWFVLIVTIVVLVNQAECKKDFWNEILYYEGNIQEKDYVKLQTRQTNSQRESNGPLNDQFYLQVFSNRTFAFQIDYSDKTPPSLITGLAVEQFLQSSMYKFNLIASEQTDSFRGQISLNYTKNLSWVYEAELLNMGVYLHKQAEISALSYSIIKIAFIILSMIIFPINRQKLSSLIYSIRVRTHPATVMVTGANILFFLSFLTMFEGFLIIFSSSLKDISLSSILAALILLVLMVIFLLPLFVYSLCIMIVLGNWLKNTQLLQQSTYKKMIFISTMVLIMVAASIILYILVQKGFLFHLIISLSAIPTFVRFFKGKINIHARYIIFDLLIKFSMTLFSLYLPIYQFTFISYKEAVLLWSLQFGSVIFAWSFMKKRMSFQLEQPFNENQIANQLNSWVPRQKLQQSDSI